MTQKKHNDGTSTDGMVLRVTALTTALLATVLVTTVAVGAVSVNAQEFQEDINESYGGADSDRAYSMVETQDGGYALVGETSSFGSGQQDAWLIKTDASGTEQWNKTYGGSRNDNARSVVQTQDGGYIIAGFTETFDGSDRDAWLIKTDASGTEQWNKTYGGTDNDQALSVVKTSDGGFALAGETESFASVSNDDDGWLIKTDPSGTEQFNESYGGADIDRAESVVQASDGGFALAGDTRSFDSGFIDAFLVKTDENGTEQFNESYGGSESGDVDLAESVVQTQDGGYALAGQTESFGPGPLDNAWLIKTHENGTKEFDETYGGTDNDAAESVVQTQDGGFALAGETSSFASASNDDDGWLIKTDASGTEQFNETYGGTDFELARSVVRTQDDGFALAGETQSFGSGDEDAWLLKISGGESISGCTDITTSGIYTLDGDIDDAPQDSCIDITASNVVFDGQGNTVDGDGSGSSGILVTNQSTTLSDVTVRNVTATDWDDGVRYGGSDNGRITGVNASSNEKNGIALSSSSGNDVTDNKATGNSMGINLFLSSDKNDITDNNASGNIGGIRIDSSTGNNASKNAVINNGVDGVTLGNSNETDVTDNNVTGNRVGVILRSSSDNNTVTDNDATGNDQDGIRVDDSNGNDVANNNATGNEFNGIFLDSSSDNEITNNNATDNDLDGIELGSSDGNNVTDNNASANGDFGIRLRSSSTGNTIGSNDAFSNGDDGVLIVSNDNEVVRNDLSFNVEGIQINGDRNDITGNNATQNSDGIFLFDSDNNNVTDNNVSVNDGEGIVLKSSSNDNNVTDNNASANGLEGIEVVDSADVEVTGNRVRRNDGSGVRAQNASGLSVRNSTVAKNDNIDLRLRTDDATLESVDVDSSVISGTATQVDIRETESAPPDPSDAENIGQYFNATNRTSSSFFDVTVRYGDSDVSDINESTLTLRRYEGSWTQLQSTVDENANTVSANVTNFSAFGVFGEKEEALFTRPLIDRFGAAPTNTGKFSDTLYEDLDGDGSGTDVDQTVAVFGELIRGKPLNGDASDGGLTDEQARALNWNQGSPETEVTPADMVSLFGKQIRAD